MDQVGKVSAKFLLEEQRHFWAEAKKSGVGTEMGRGPAQRECGGQRAGVRRNGSNGMSVETIGDGRADVESRQSEGVVEALLRIASRAQFFRSADGRFHAQVPIGARDEIYGLKSTAFCDWLIESYRCERGELPAAGAVRSVVTSVVARARFHRSVPAVHVRVGREGEPGTGDLYIDLGDSSGRSVKINGRGWLVVDKPAVKFRRPDGQLPLPVPNREGSIERLHAYVNLSEPDFRLLVGWLAAALLPEGPYPVLAIHGEQGSAKSTLAKVVRMLVDPQASPLLAQPCSTRDLMVTSLGGWLLVYDNISTLPNWLSDGLCRLATGGGFSGRAFYSDDERRTIHAERPIVLNGVDEFVRRDDLADRCAFLLPPPISLTSRRAESEFWQAFRADYPAIFGGLLDAIVGGLRGLPSVNPLKLPRMADFARFGEAVGRGLGWPAETFLSIYSDNRREAVSASLEDSPLARVLIECAELGGLREEWKLSPTEMLDELNRDVPGQVRMSAQWPKTVRAFSDDLRRIAPALRTRGISVEFGKTNASRLITIRAEPA